MRNRQPTTPTSPPPPPPRTQCEEQEQTYGEEKPEQHGRDRSGVIAACLITSIIVVLLTPASTLLALADPRNVVSRPLSIAFAVAIVGYLLLAFLAGHTGRSSAWALIVDSVIVLLARLRLERCRCGRRCCANQAQLFVPKGLSVNYFITRQCNYSCGFCFHTAKTSTTLTKAEARRGLRMLREAGMHKINFAGGEPFLKKQFLGDLCRFCKEDMGINVSIITNGSLVTEQWLSQYGRYVDVLGVSCDSFVEATNIRIGRSDRKKVQHTEHLFRVRELCDRFGIIFKLNTVVNQFNKDEDMRDFIASLKPARWKVFQCLLQENENGGQEAGDLRDARPFLITDEEFHNFLRRHEAFDPIAEDNDTMRNSYILLDEQLRVLDCSSGAKLARTSVLDGVEQALEQAGFEQEEFIARGGVYQWSRSQPAPCATSATGKALPDIESIKDPRCSTTSPSAQIITHLFHSLPDAYAILRASLDRGQLDNTPEMVEFFSRLKALLPTNTDAVQLSLGSTFVLAVEGLDGCGKSTLVDELLQAFGDAAQKFRTPPSSIAALRPAFDSEHICEETARAFYSASNYLACAEIAAQRPTVAIMDRFYHSTCAYTLGRLPISSLMATERRKFEWPADLPKPDLAVQLYMPEDARKHRLQGRTDGHGKWERLFASDPSFASRVTMAYQRQSRRQGSFCKLHRVDASGSIQDIVDQVLGLAKSIGTVPLFT
jgi:radical S-adenosyl methionine domain-containing protein 2